ncbi:MAG: hypothetical protein V1921_06810 [Candidatus Altiarchaeota archaeon]
MVLIVGGCVTKEVKEHENVSELNQTSSVTSTVTSTTSSTSTVMETTSIAETTTSVELTTTTTVYIIPSNCTKNRDCGIEYYSNLRCDSYDVYAVEYRPVCYKRKCMYRTGKEILKKCSEPVEYCIEGYGCSLSTASPAYSDALLVTSYEFNTEFLGKKPVFNQYSFRINNLTYSDMGEITEINIGILKPSGNTTNMSVLRAANASVDSIRITRWVGAGEDKEKGIIYATMFMHQW